MKIVDVGDQFGMNCSDIFRPVHPQVLTPQGLNQFLEAIQEKPDLVIFGGGEDVHPKLYGHRNAGAGCGKEIGMRDKLEVMLWHHCQKHKIPILGICRGSQFTCVMSGGALIQHCPGHTSPDRHDITTVDGMSFKITSTHHQMMWPDKVYDHELLAWAVNLTKGKLNYDDAYSRTPPTWTLKEPEIVYFPKFNALAVQGHPEWMDPECDTVKYIRKLVSQKLWKKDIDGNV